MFEKSKIKQVFQFLKDKDFKESDSKNYVKYTKGDLSIDLHYDNDYRDKYMYVVINSKFGRQNLLDTNIFNESERTRYNKELGNMSALFDMQQHFEFYSNIIKTKIDDILKFI